MSDIKVYDNFLVPDEFNHLNSVFEGSDIDWYYNDYVVDSSLDKRDYQLIHNLYTNYGFHISNFMTPLNCLIDKINPTALIRVKANMNLWAGNENYIHGYHTDYSHPAITTAVYYINDNDGFTIFEETGEKIYSVANRLVEFPSRMVHSGSTATNVKSRIVINLNYVK